MPALVGERLLDLELALGDIVGVLEVLDGLVAVRINEVHFVLVAVKTQHFQPGMSPSPFKEPEHRPNGLIGNRLAILSTEASEQSRAFTRPLK